MHSGPGQPLCDCQPGLYGVGITVSGVGDREIMILVARSYHEDREMGCGSMLTPIIARFTRSFLIRSIWARFSINSALEEPEQYQAMENRLAGIVLVRSLDRCAGLRSMQWAVGVLTSNEQARTNS